jgi:hypothetical protein
MAAGGAVIRRCRIRAVGVYATAETVASQANIKANWLVGWGLPVEELRKLQQWGELLHGIKDSLNNTTVCRLLSHHTSRTCQPQKQAGVASLKIIGWENPIEVDEGKSIKVHMAFPHAYWFGDKLGVRQI